MVRKVKRQPVRFEMPRCIVYGLPIVGGCFGWSKAFRVELLDEWPHLWPYTFAVGRDPDERPPVWRVLNVEIGAGVSAAETRELAVARARDILAIRTRRDVHEAVRRRVRAGWGESSIHGAP